MIEGVVFSTVTSSSEPLPSFKTAVSSSNSIALSLFNSKSSVEFKSLADAAAILKHMKTSNIKKSIFLLSINSPSYNEFCISEYK